MSTPNVTNYTGLITSEHSNKPNFIAMVSGIAAAYVQIQKVLASMIPLFDLATPPVGDQLDIIGQWVGASRDIPIPIEGVLFTWDGTASEGWDYGVWSSPANPTTVTVLPDSAYLTLIRAKIAANSWDGTTEGAYAVWSLIFPNNELLIIDFQNMSYSIALSGAPLDSLTLALLTGGYLPLRPEGIEITEYIVPGVAGPLFGWDIENDFVQGWDQGAWGVEIAPT